MGADLKEVYMELKLKKRICVFVHELNRSGASIVMYDAITIMKSSGCDIVVISPMEGPLHEAYEKIGVSVIISEEYFDMLYREKGLNDCLKNDMLEQLYQFDQIWFLTILTAPMLKCCENMNLPMVWWIHEGKECFYTSSFGMPKKIKDNVLVLVVGEYTRRVLKSYGFQYSEAVLNYGVEDKGKGYFHSSIGKDYFLMVGTFCSRKGQDILIESLAYLDNNIINNSNFLFVGEAIDVQYAEKINEMAKEYKNIGFVSTVDRNELFSYYANMKCLICPSRDDPMPVVVTEAAMLSKPIICSDRIGQAEYIRKGDEHVVFNNLSPVDLARAITKVYYDNNLCKKLGQYNRKIYEKLFAYDTMKVRLLQIINGL